MATVFRLDHRGQTAGQRAVITQRGYVATRLGLEALLPQLYREALQRGLGQAQQVLVIADGAVWIWNLVKDRFPKARQRLDLWHADEHLWAVAHDLYGQGTPEAHAWVQPLLQQVRNDQTFALIADLTELKPRLQEAQQKKLQTQIEYFEHNARRMKYKEVIDARKAVADGNATAEQLKLANQPLGSGAIESTCRQYQCRFKRTGQFWTTAGDEALMCLETFWRNGRWHELYPHAKANVALN
jgi:transposase